MRCMFPKPHELYCGALRAQGPDTEPLTLTLTLTLNLMHVMFPKLHLPLLLGPKGPGGTTLNP